MPDQEFNAQIIGVEDLIRKLDRLGLPVIRPAIAEAGAHLKNVAAEYPPRVYGLKNPPKTRKQFFFLIHAIPEGRIDFPYRRGQSPTSEAVGRRWTIEFRDDGKTAVVGNNASYIHFLMGKDDQSDLHKQIGWKTDEQIVLEEAEPVREILARHYRNAIRR